MHTPKSEPKEQKDSITKKTKVLQRVYECSVGTYNVFTITLIFTLTHMITDEDRWLVPPQ